MSNLMLFFADTHDGTKQEKIWPPELLVRVLHQAGRLRSKSCHRSIRLSSRFQDVPNAMCGSTFAFEQEAALVKLNRVSSLHLLQEF
jgi:hypothetical protein